MDTTIRAQDFRLVSCQATLFTPDEEVSSIKLLQGLLPQWTYLFDAEPTLGPAAGGLPREIPKLILESTSHAWRCQIASARIDLFWQQQVVEIPDITLHNFFEQAIEFLNAYREFLHAHVGRMAAVLNRYAVHPTPGPLIARHFCHNHWLTGQPGQLESCEVYFHTPFVLAESFQVNLWFRNRTGTVSSGEQSNPAVLLEQDLNTLAESIRTETFEREAIGTFFHAAMAKFDESLQFYYPAEGQL